MVRQVRFLFFLCVLGAVAACQTLPDEVDGYQDDCIRLNTELIPPTSSDPHFGYKNVYACNVSLETIKDPNFTTYPDGTMIVKDSTREEQDYTWLIATAKKVNGAWEWKEYKRNFANEDFVQILAGQGVCRGCHEAVADTGDWMFTHYEGP